MTQFLLARSTRSPRIQSFVVCSVQGDAFLEPIAERTFGTSSGTWVVRPDGGEMDSTVESACAWVIAGNPFSHTSLGKLLDHLVSCCDELALFDASFPDDLPAVETADELLGVVENDLADPHFRGELFVRWSRIEQTG